MLYNVIIIAILAVGVLGIAISSIVVLTHYARKRPNWKVEVNVRLFGCSFGAKASTWDSKADKDGPTDNTNPKEPSIVKRSS